MKTKGLIVCHLLVLLLLGTFLWPVTAQVWQMIDISVFKVLNHTLQDSPPLQLFWALVNHKKADLVEDAIFIAFFLFAICKAPQGQRVRKVAEFIFCIVLAATIIHFVNRTLLRDQTLIPRKSPSLVITPCVRLSEEIPWLTIKDATNASFPGDHATTLLLFAGLYTTFAGRKFGFYATLYAIFRILPRLIVGAHWFSDIVVGSGCLALFFLSWALCTPAHVWVIDKIEKILKLRKNEIQKNTL